MSDTDSPAVLTIYVPDLVSARGWMFARHLLPGSAVVGGDDQDPRTVYYEGNRHRSANVVTFADRVAVAASRLVQRYPTIARQTLPAEALRPVGTFSLVTRTVLLDDEPALAAWLRDGATGVEPHELLISGT